MMKFRISRTSIRDFDHKWDVKKIHPRAERGLDCGCEEIKDKEGLVMLSEESKIIVSWDSIEIYDSYRE